MKAYKKALILALALLFVMALAACDARIGASEKMITSYFKLASDSADKVTVLDVANYGEGYLAAAMFSGSGGHLALYKVAKADGAEKLAAVSEGDKSRVDGFSVNTLTDGEYTIVFGDIAGDMKDFNKVEVTFDDGSKLTDSVAAGKGYVIVAQGKKFKDLVMTGPNDKKTDLAAYLKDGGSLTTTSFVEVPNK